MKELVESGDLAIFIIICFLILLGFIAEIFEQRKKRRKRKVFKEWRKNLKIMDGGIE